MLAFDERALYSFFLLACAPYPEGLLATPAGDGPMVDVDWDAEPLPEIPFPNDLSARPDPSTRTGLRLNLPLDAPTEQENETRAKINELDGFGTYAPLTVSFNAPLDLAELALRHRSDSRLGAESFDDDAVFVVDVTPGSPTYLQAVDLDIGQGHFPMDVPNPNRYFPNDTRFDNPSVVFDTTEEDLDGDGELDFGEDIDFDGILDHPNVWPAGGDARADLLSWYEKSTDTLIFRPVVPLRERTRYAVILTDRLVGEDGEPVRSPFAYVHHLRQTESLRPLEDVMPKLGLTLENVAFAWSFTTGSQTADMVDIRLGLYGEGPLAGMATTFPAQVTEALPLHELNGNPETWRLPSQILVDQLVTLGLLDGPGGPVVADNYAAFGDVVVGGALDVPYFLADRDDGGAWDADEWFSIDVSTGSYAAKPQRVAFTCVIPKEGLTQQPYPVVLFGHGYGSSRFDFLGFSWAINRMGWAACAADFPGHGPTVDPDQEVLIEGVLGSLGLLPFYTHLLDSRYRDLDNDGRRDSGGDQWTADAFHTRDMVRQAAVDWIQMVRAFKACGTGEMSLPDGGTAASCDWDGNGIPDIGGADGRFSIIGGSLGGINAAVAAAVMPEVESFGPIVPGGGLLDVAVRTEIGGAVEAMFGRLVTPMFLGYPDGSGGIRVTQLVNSVADMRELPVGSFPSIPAGATLRVENLDNGTMREGALPADGVFRISIGADAPDPFEKRLISGMPESGPEEGGVYSVADNEGLGDHLQISLVDADGAVLATLNQWTEAVVHEGVTMEAGSPLISASHGTGHVRSTPQLRRLAMVFGAILEPGDAIAYAPHYVLEPFEELGGRPANVLLMPTAGDTIVNVNTGIALARAAGFIDRTKEDPRYGMSQDQWLIDRKVVQGLEEFGPYVCADGRPCLFDVENGDRGTDGIGATSDTPLHATVESTSGLGALRLSYADPQGSHGFALPEPDKPFDINTYSLMQIVSFTDSGGTRINDDLCLADASCVWIPSLPQGGGQ